VEKSERKVFSVVYNAVRQQVINMTTVFHTVFVELFFLLFMFLSTYRL